MSNVRTLRREIATAALAMQTSRGREQTMQVAADAVRNLVPGCTIAAISVLTRDGVQSPVYSADPAAVDGPVGGSHDAVRSIDELQYEIREGACFDAMNTNEAVHSNDLASDTRWPRWAPKAAADLGMRSLVSHPLAVGGKVLGALNIYGAQERAFTSDDLGLTATFAVHVSVALAATRDVENLTDAMDSRSLIGQATGILMMRYDLDADLAFAVLARTSQTTNVKLRNLAEHVVTTRKLPED